MASISAECPICFERYSGPIFLCETGHSICGQCTSQVTQCPTCRAPMTKGRNFGLEAILSELAHSSSSRNLECCFKECRKTFQTQDGLKSHKKDCEFRDVICGSCSTSVPYGDFIYHLIQVHNVQEKSMDIHIPINLDKIKSKDGEKYILYNENGENLLVNMMVQNGLFYIWIEHLKSNGNSGDILSDYTVKFLLGEQSKMALALLCPLLAFRSYSNQEILDNYFPFNLSQLENFRGTGTPINSIVISSNANNPDLPLNESAPELNLAGLNLSEIEIKEAEFRLDQDNLEILSSLKQNTTVKLLRCANISVKKLEEILKKFNETEDLRFFHTLDSVGKCKYFNSSSDSGDCTFKLPQNIRWENLKKLYINNLEINTGDVNIVNENLPALKKLAFYNCNIRGNLVNICTRLFALEEIQLFGNTPLLEKKDVETLLRIKSLKKLYLNKFLHGQVISGSFIPIGPDGKPFDKITQNAQIHFVRDPNNQPWKMTVTPKE